MTERLLKGKEGYGAEYMDDLIVFSTEFDENTNQLRDILKTLQQANLTVTLSKWSFLQSQDNGILEPHQTKMQAFVFWEQPKAKKDVKSFQI